MGGGGGGGGRGALCPPPPIFPKSFGQSWAQFRQNQRIFFLLLNTIFIQCLLLGSHAHTLILDLLSKFAGFLNTHKKRVHDPTPMQLCRAGGKIMVQAWIQDSGQKCDPTNETQKLNRSIRPCPSIECNLRVLL